MNYGYIERPIEDDHYTHLGGQVPTEIFFPDGHGWGAFLPSEEVQIKNTETQNCTAFGTSNAIETLLRKKFGIDENYSDRYIGICAGTTEEGNDPHTVAESIRKTGNILESLLPFEESIKSFEDYFKPRPMTSELLWQGRGWLKKFNFKHEWVLTGNETNWQSILKEKLKSSPLGVAVYAWEERNGLFIRPEGRGDSHWTMMYDYKEGEYWNIFDSYPPHQKKLAWNYSFQRAKRYWVNQGGTRLSLLDYLTYYFSLLK